MNNCKRAARTWAVSSACASGADATMTIKGLPDNPLPFVFVLWDDAWKTSTEDATKDNAKDSHKPVVAVAAGWVLRADEEGIQLGAEYSPDGTHRNRSFIPRVLIKEVIPVNVTRVRKRRDIGQSNLQRAGTTNSTGQPA